MSIALPQAYGNIATYRFYVVIPPATITQEVFPLNFLSTSLVDTLEGTNAFYRRTFNGSLVFGTNSLAIDDTGATVNRKDDWLYFWDLEQNSPCTDIDFLITKTVSGITTTYWEGYFSTSDGRFDIDKCTFEVTPIVYDDYTDILDKAELQQNILSVTTVVSTNAYVAGHIDIDYTRNRWLMDVIEYLANDVVVGVVPGCTVSSDFFTAAVNPVSLGTNYVEYLTIAQKSDIIRPASSNPATTAMMSWNDLTEILWSMFQVQWDYDSVTDTINVEHCSWAGFAPAAGIDLTTQMSCKATNKYTYLKESMPKYERFSFMEADENNFVRSEIWYDSPCVNQDPKTNMVETAINVTTDLEYIIDNPDAISDDGFVILANYLDGGNYYVALQPGEYNPTVRLNMHLSWANLEYFYFRHNRILLSGYMNAVLRTFVSAQKTKVQECTAIVCDAFDPTEEITTELGDTYFGGEKGKVQRAELKPDGSIKLNLLYGPVDNANPGVTPNMVFVVVQQANCLEWDATFPEPVDEVGGIDINVKHILYDSTGALRCTNTETWNVADGSRTDSFTITPCLAMNPGDYMDISFPYVPAMHGWTADAVYNDTCTY